jgi:NAD(P)-dependent dehydrogenase (short-subunit alcohol dehydrogenase family)
VVWRSRRTSATRAVAGAVAAIRERGRLDGVVANVAALRRGGGRTSADRFRRQLELNLVGGFNVLRAVTRCARRGRVSSATATGSATPLFGAYGAAKAAVEHLTGTLAAEWGPEVRVNCVAPGLIRTEGSLAAVFRGDEALVARAGATTAVGRIGEPEDVAYACQYLLSAAASYVSGAVLVVDGGPTEGPTQRILRALEG